MIINSSIYIYIYMVTGWHAASRQTVATVSNQAKGFNILNVVNVIFNLFSCTVNDELMC